MNLLDKDGSRFTNARTITIVLGVVGALSLSAITVFFSTNKIITIADDTNRIQVVTDKKAVKEILFENHIKLAKEDLVTPSIESIATDRLQIQIRRAIPIQIAADGKIQNVLTTKQTVQEVLDEQNIALTNGDKLNIDPTEKVVKNLVLNITRVLNDTIVENEPIDFRVVEKSTTRLARGDRRVANKGIPGQKEKVYKIVYENSKIVSKKLISTRIVAKPINQVVEVGTEPLFAMARGGGDFRYSKVLTMSATAYTAGYESTGKNPGDRGYGRTATGMIAQKGVVAVDPSVIPMGTKLYVENADGAGSYGYAIAADKGRAIVGNKIDLFYESLSEALRFGRRNVKVYVLEK